ncbi:MAG: DUF3043 domain-containing protein [Microbacteriaceae bacterium]|nr:DUF3043 domain-containing protein [Microbacteriaceae bacterium]
MAKHDPSQTEPDGAKTGKKGPTPKRRDREAENFRPLVPEDRKEARKQAQAKMRTEQAKARAGMAAGDDRYLRPGERGPQKRFLRDFVDSRFTLGELLIPLMFIVIFATMLPAETNASVWAMFAIWAYLALCIGEGILLGVLARRKVQAVVGPERTEKGFVMQALGRAMQMRFLRMPRAQVKRFEKVEFTANYRH